MKKTLLTASGAAAAAALLAPQLAVAGPVVTPHFDFGGYASVSFGRGMSPRWGLGLEARGYAMGQECVESTSVYGALTRLDFRPGEPRLIVAAHGGRVFSAISAAHLEAGVGYRWGEDAGVETIVGGGVSGLLLGHMHLNVDLLSARTTLGTGLRLPTFPSAGCFVIEGRPLRAADGFVELPDVFFARRPEHTDALELWTRRAQTEWASVPAFMQLAEQLELLGAPPVLADAAERAAEDEARHAFLSAGVASRAAADTPMILDAVSPETRALAFGRDGLIRLAVESWYDGCLGEGAAAAVAAAEAERADDVFAQQSQRMIAIDERRHAELAWNTLEWTVSVGGDSVRNALRAARDVHYEDNELSGTLHHTERDELLEQNRKRSMTRLDALL